MKNKDLKKIIAIFAVIFTFAPFQHIFAENDSIIDIENIDNYKYTSGEIIVKLKDESLEDMGDVNIENEVAIDHKLQKKDDLAADSIDLLKIKDNKSVAQKIVELNSDPRVEFAQPNYIYHQFGEINTNDTRKNSQWGLNNTGQTVTVGSTPVTGTADADIDAPEAWSTSEGADNQVIVAILDDGIAYNHPDLAANLWDGTNCKDENNNSLGGCIHGYNFAANSKDPMETGTDTHGTHLAGIIGAVKNNGKGIVGIAPNVKIMAVKFDTANMTTTDAIKGVRFAKYNGAKIINASWGGYGEDLALKAEIEAFDGIFATSAGNGDAVGNGYNNDPISGISIFPCNTNSGNIICSASTDQDDKLSSFSNYGSVSVDVGSPGTNIVSTLRGAGIDDGSSELYGYGNGTSMSTAFISGEAALIWAYKPQLSTAEVKSTILNTGDNLPALNGKTVTGKRINLYNALNNIVTAVQPAPQPFASSGIGFSSKQVKNGKTSESKITMNFDNIENAAQYMISSHDDFAGEQWNPIEDSVKISFRKKVEKKYFVKFKDENGLESAVFSKKISYEPVQNREIKNSKKRVKTGDLLIQSGKRFSKNSKVALYFNSKPVQVSTNKKGAFSVAFRVNKPKGNYSWYAVDLKTGKKSKAVKYKVI